MFTYTTLKKEITIDQIVTIHYFELLKDYKFMGERHDFWEFLYVDKGTIIVQEMCIRDRSKTKHFPQASVSK